MGEAPYWYSLYVAARWLGMDPDVLAHKPKLMMLRALEARAAEIRAQKGPTSKPLG